MKYLIFLFVISVIVLPAKFIIPLSILIMVLYFSLDRTVLNILKRKSTLFLFAIVAIIQPILIGEPTNSMMGVSYSGLGFINGLAMFCRAIVIINSISILNRRTDKESIRYFWGKLGIEQFDAVFTKSQEQLPEIKESFSKSIKNINGKNLLKPGKSKPAEFFANLIVPFLHKSNSLSSKNNFNEE